MSYNVNSFVNQNEANALKEMIFRRAREHAQTLTDDVQSDVMDIARESFVSKGNPFTQIIEKTNTETLRKQDEEPEKINEEIPDGLGFKQRQLNAHALEENRVINQQISSSTIQNNMEEARKTLSNKKSFMGALNFLNSQAAVSLMRTRADKFEIVV